jgi:prophage antirepressor-like protein
MAGTIIDIYNRILKYDGNSIYIAFHSKTNEPYFHANQVCELLKYQNAIKALQKNVSKENIFYLKNIVKNHKELYKNVQGHTKFLNEAGLNEILLKGRKEYSELIYKWITSEVMPSIRKYGEYRLNHTYKKQIDELNEKLKEKQKEIEVLKHNLRKQKYPEEGAVYIMRVINDNMDFDENQIIDIKFGRTKNMNKRIKNYNSCTKNKVQILKIIYVQDPKNIENCVIKKMEEKQIKDKKEYFRCSFLEIMNEISSCVLFFENKEIDKSPEIQQLSRMQFDNFGFFDKNKEYIIKFLDDDEFDKLFGCEKKNNSELTSDIDSDSESDSDDDEQILLDSENEIQSGGTLDISYKWKYLYCLKNLLEMKFDFL